MSYVSLSVLSTAHMYRLHRMMIIVKQARLIAPCDLALALYDYGTGTRYQGYLVLSVDITIIVWS